MTTTATNRPLPKAAHTAPLASLGGAAMALSSSSAGIVAKFATACGGVWIEQAETPLGTTRVWRFADAPGRPAEWADLAEVQGGRPRWYGSCYTAKDFVLC